MPYALPDLIKLFTVNTVIERKFIERDFFAMSLNPYNAYRTIFKGVGFFITDDPVTKMFGLDKMPILEVREGAYSCLEYPIKNVEIRKDRKNFILPESNAKNGVQGYFAIADCSQAMRFMDEKDNSCYQTLVFCYDGEVYLVEHSQGVEKGFTNAKHSRITNVKDASFYADLQGFFSEYPNFAKNISTLNVYSAGKSMKLSQAKAIMQLAFLL